MYFMLFIYHYHNYFLTKLLWEKKVKSCINVFITIFVRRWNAVAPNSKHNSLTLPRRIFRLARQVVDPYTWQWIRAKLIVKVLKYPFLTSYVI